MCRGGLRLHLCFSIQSLRFDVSLSALAGGMFVNRLQRVLGKGGKVRRHCSFGEGACLSVDCKDLWEKMGKLERHCSRKELAKEWRKARK